MELKELKIESSMESVKEMELTDSEWKTVLDGLDALDGFFANELPPDSEGRKAIGILIEKIKGNLNK